MFPYLYNILRKITDGIKMAKGVEYWIKIDDAMLLQLLF